MTISVRDLTIRSDRDSASRRGDFRQAGPHEHPHRAASDAHPARIDLKMHWHRNIQRDPKNRWLRDIVASLFTDELDEWHL